MKQQIMALTLLITISALLVWLPNTNTMFDTWRVGASIVTFILATVLGATILLFHIIDNYKV